MLRGCRHDPERCQFLTYPRRHSFVQGILAAHRAFCTDFRWFQVLGIGGEVRGGRPNEATGFADRTQNLPVLRSEALEAGREIAGCGVDKVHPRTGLRDQGEGQQRGYEIGRPKRSRDARRGARKFK